MPIEIKQSGVLVIDQQLAALSEQMLNYATSKLRHSGSSFEKIDYHLIQAGDRVFFRISPVGQAGSSFLDVMFAQNLVVSNLYELMAELTSKFSVGSAPSDAWEGPCLSSDERIQECLAAKQPIGYVAAGNRQVTGSSMPSQSVNTNIPGLHWDTRAFRHPGPLETWPNGNS